MSFDVSISTVSHGQCGRVQTLSEQTGSSRVSFCSTKSRFLIPFAFCYTLPNYTLFISVSNSERCRCRCRGSLILAHSPPLTFPNGFHQVKASGFSLLVLFRCCKFVQMFFFYSFRLATISFPEHIYIRRDCVSASTSQRFAHCKTEMCCQCFFLPYRPRTTHL